MNEFFNNRYFNSKFNDNCKGFTTNNVIQYYCKKSIEKYLKNIGFLINNHVYSFEPKYFFEETNNDDIEEKNEYKYKFKITFYNEDLNDESKIKNYIVIGKDLLHDTHLTIDNEEYLVYFYTKKQEYFSSNIIDIYKSNYSNKAMKPYQYSIIIIAIIIILNIISFLLYLYYKNKKKKKFLNEKIID